MAALSTPWQQVSPPSSRATKGTASLQPSPASSQHGGSSASPLDVGPGLSQGGSAHGVGTFASPQPTPVASQHGGSGTRSRASLQASAVSSQQDDGSGAVTHADEECGDAGDAGGTARVCTGLQRPGEPHGRQQHGLNWPVV